MIHFAIPGTQRPELPSQKYDPGRTRTCNLWFRRPTPYPLGHRARCNGVHVQSVPTCANFLQWLNLLRAKRSTRTRTNLDAGGATASDTSGRACFATQHKKHVCPRHLPGLGEWFSFKRWRELKRICARIGAAKCHLWDLNPRSLR